MRVLRLWERKAAAILLEARHLAGNRVAVVETARFLAVDADAGLARHREGGVGEGDRASLERVTRPPAKAG